MQMNFRGRRGKTLNRRQLAQVFMLPLLTACLLLLSLLLLGAPPASQAQSGITDFTTIRASAFWMASPKTTRVLTNNATLNPLGTFQPISSATAIGTSGANITVKSAGTLLILRNVGAQTITITETGTLISAGNIVLGAEDSATLLSDGTNWVQIGASNN
jgi:hypothetical protein